MFVKAESASQRRGGKSLEVKETQIRSESLEKVTSQGEEVCAMKIERHAKSSITFSKCCKEKNFTGNGGQGGVVGKTKRITTTKKRENRIIHLGPL